MLCGCLGCAVGILGVNVSRKKWLGWELWRGDNEPIEP